MRARRNVSAIGFYFYLVLFLLCPGSSNAQDTGISADWSAVERLAAGTQIAVKMKTGQGVEGALNRVLETSLTLITSRGKREDLNRTDIVSLYELKKKSATKSTLIGAGLGAAGGVIVGAVVGDSGPSAIVSKGKLAAGAGAVGGGIGTLIGYALHRGSKRILVYQSGS